MPVVEERGASKAQAKECLCEACKKGRYEPSKIAPLTIHGYSSRPNGGWVKQMTQDERAWGEAQGTVPSLFMGVELETSVQDRNPRPTYAEENAQRRAIVRELNRLHPLPEFYGTRYDAEGDYTPEYEAHRRESRTASYARSELEDRLYSERFGLPPLRPQPLVSMTAEEAVSLAEPVGFWHAKHDSSVSGPEFASLPGTLDYWYSIEADLARMFTGLLHGNVRSHSGDTCGMHISINVETFSDSEHLMRFARLVNSNPSWTRRMSQRTAHSMSWGRCGTGPFTPSSNDYQLRRWADRVMQTGVGTHTDRYSAINATCGGGRIEFRVPRGTLRLDRFFKNLEWMAAMVEYTREFAPTDSASFMRWVMGVPGRFSYLKGWFTEKFGLEPTAEFMPARAERSERAVMNEQLAEAVVSGREMCACNDGCFADDCGSCEDDRRYSQELDEADEDLNFYGDDEPETFTCHCGLTHDLDLDMYQGPRLLVPLAEQHVWARDGGPIGLERRFNMFGEEFQYGPDQLPLYGEPTQQALRAQQVMQTGAYIIGSRVRRPSIQIVETPVDIAPIEEMQPATSEWLTAALEAIGTFSAPESSDNS